MPIFARGQEFNSLSDAEQEAVWESYNRPIPLSETQPLSPVERAHHKRAKAKMRRPKIGKGSKLISVTVEKSLPAKADAYAKEIGAKRAQLIAMGLRSILPLRSIMRPLNPIHPGVMLNEEFILPSAMSQRSLAKKLGWTVAKLNELIKGKRGVTADSALDLAAEFGTSPELWLNLQMLFDLRQAELRRKKAS